jgi:hypothetical protein
VFNLGGPEVAMLLFRAEERNIEQGRGEYGPAHLWALEGTSAPLETVPRMQGHAHHDSKHNQEAGEESSHKEYEHHGIFSFS